MALLSVEKGASAKTITRERIEAIDRQHDRARARVRRLRSVAAVLSERTHDLLMVLHATGVKYDAATKLHAARLAFLEERDQEARAGTDENRRIEALLAITGEQCELMNERVAALAAAKQEWIIVTYRT